MTFEGIVSQAARYVPLKRAIALRILEAMPLETLEKLGYQPPGHASPQQKLKTRPTHIGTPTRFNLHRPRFR